MKKISVGAVVLILGGMMLVQGLILYAMGRLIICSCGFIELWHGNINSAGNSQQITDWYTFSHVIHGFLFYLLLRYLTPKLPVSMRLVLAALLEIIWELIENSSFIINRYRAVTAAFGYVGDSILNSVIDTLSVVVGFLLAYRLPVWVVVVLGIFFELFTLYFVRDNLTLNVVMLAFPLESIKNWQLGM